ncbi:MAG: hypothetical protein P9L97_02625 [Candidatus Tenebribacter davisii]|nr:hypothetical protein [Candidatus Tenebribacter davisii]
MLIQKLSSDILRAFQIIITVIMIMGLVYVSIGKLLPEDFFHETSSLYFFSALLQSNAAIFSLFGVFIIFRLQSLQSSLDLLKNTLMQDRGKIITTYSVIEFDNMSLEEKEEKIETFGNTTTIYFLIKSWLDKEKSIDKIKKSIKDPVISMTIVMILNLFGLIFSNYIHNVSFYLELFTNCVFVILQIHIFLLLIKSINQLLDN